MTDPTPLYVIIAYLLLLVGLGFVSTRFFRGTSTDYFVASRSIGPFMLLMSVFGTTMTAFALVGSTGKSFQKGIGVYGLMASWSGLIHSAVFFLVGIKLWALGKRHGYVTQIQYFRDRFQSDFLGYLLFPILVGLVIPYLLIGLLGAGSVISGVTRGMFPEVFSATNGAVPPWLTGLVICTVVLFYVFFGGVRSAAWANTFQTLVFMVTGVIIYFIIASKLGGAAAAGQMVLEHSPGHLMREGMIGQREFLTYAFVPLSVGMFPHLFQHWLTARTAKTFRLTVIAHPIFIMIVWVPCILIGIWAAGLYAAGELRVPTLPSGAPNANAVLAAMVKTFGGSPLLIGLVTAGILAAIMSSLDSQFVCLGSMFTNDIVLHKWGKDRLSDTQKVWVGRGFVLLIVAITYVLSLQNPRKVFDLGVWCFSGFASLFPLVLMSIYWKRTTREGAVACIVATFIAWVICFARADYGGNEGLIAGMMPVTVIFAVSLVTIVVVSLMTRPPDREHVARFFQS